MGLAPGSFRGNRVVLRKEAYERVHGLLNEYNPGQAVNIMFALAHIGLHTTSEEKVGTDEVWLLDGWER